MQKTRIHVQEVSIKPKKIDLSHGLSDKIYYECAFCNKTQGSNFESRKICEKMSGNIAYYCTFCLRNGFNAKSNKDILTITFRSIIGYLYYDLYKFANPNNRLYLSQIQDMIEMHAKIGLTNPLFKYDYETFLWFIDFGKVGKGRRKIKINEINKTISDILTCFNLHETVKGLNLDKFQTKFDEAILKFYQQRFRPDGKKLLEPTFVNCGVWDVTKKFKFEDTRSFESKNLLAV